jgi:hypothetical protein
MKKFLLFLLSFLPLFAIAQSDVYHPFPSDNGCWRYQYFDDIGNPTSDFGSYSMYGDTVIAGMNYKKISGAPSFSTIESGAIRESGKIIYYRPDTSSTEFVLYNFNLNPGDTIFNPYGGTTPGFGNDTVIVLSADSALLSDGYHRQLYLTSFCNWIEGIGSTFYLLKPCRNLPLSGNDRISCMYADSVPLYTYGFCAGCGTVDAKEISASAAPVTSPNPFNFQTAITFNRYQTNSTIKIMDISGKEIRTMHFTGKQLVIDKGEMPPGIYFIQITDDQKNSYNEKLVVE